MALEIKVNQKKEEGIKGKIYTRLRYYKQTNNLKKKKQFANGFECRDARTTSQSMP